MLFVVRCGFGQNISLTGQIQTEVMMMLKVLQEKLVYYLSVLMGNGVRQGILIIKINLWIVICYVQI